MSKKTFQFIRIILVIIVATVVSSSIVLKISLLIPLSIIVAAMAILYLLSTRVKEVMVDERSHLINEKAASTTLGIYAPLAGIGAVVLAMMNEKDIPEFLNTASILSYSTCALLFIYAALQKYYERNH